ncbi:hypothetical protein HNP48_004996 [Acidovorax soli]|uniref:Uncharacterized protein n=1 Tax=Acidovorax soli TaxID=592050 RepID=A0A7X0PI32_9BURK|nr:hypothetical protein [Acidovorax soli]MBB6562286.1 hypothetical protein [Acidovorax soli]
MLPVNPADEPAPSHLESTELGEFIELRLQDGGTRLRVRSGTIGQPCLVLNATYGTSAKAQAHYQRLQKEWQERDFVPCKPSLPVADGSVADELFCDARIPHPLLEPFLAINGADELRGQPRRLAWFRHGLRWHTHFDLERIADFGLHAGVIVEGDVQVDGVFSQLTYTYPGQTLVSGSIHATSFGHGDSDMRVMGDVKVNNIVYGEYNDGSLVIHGAMYGRAFVCVDHDMHAEGGYHLPICDWNAQGDWDGYLHLELFDDGTGDPGTMVSAEAMRRFMREGRDPFRPGAQPVMREPAPEPPPPPPLSLFAQRVRDLVHAEDVEGLTQLIETWPDHGEEWQQALIGRLYAPSTTPEQRARLKALQKKKP